MTSDPITAEQVRRVLLVLAADEVRLARDFRDVDPPPLTIAQLLDHANAGMFCRSLAHEANDNGRLAAAEQSIAAHRAKPRRRP